MTTPTLLERLIAHRTIGRAPVTELQWLIDHGRLETKEAGEYLARKGQTVEESETGLGVLLEGHLTIYVDRGGGPRLVMEWQGGDLMGLLPFSRMRASPGDAIVQARLESLVIPPALFPQLIRECPVVTEICVHTMLDRARVFNTSDWQDEKLASLGKLAAGLAHELNNPAAAIARSGRLLQRSILEADRAARELVLQQLDEEQLAAIDRFREECVAGRTAPTSPLQRAEREDDLTEWLLRNCADDSAVEVLLETNVTLDQLEKLAAVLDRGALTAAIEWVAASCAIHNVAKENELAAARISELVGAMKRLTHMDRAPAPEPVDLEQGIRDTVAILGHKARDKGATVEIEIDRNLPHVHAIGGELNQVWMNLIDNALDAIDRGGKVSIHAQCEGEWVMVRVIDNGHGIDPEHRARIFDPFFTTKRPGEGTGLGLEVARTRVRGNGGDISFQSQPGRTEFRVYLPIRQTAPSFLPATEVPAQG